MKDLQQKLPLEPSVRRSRSGEVEKFLPVGRGRKWSEWERGEREFWRRVGERLVELGRRLEGVGGRLVEISGSESGPAAYGMREGEETSVGREMAEAGRVRERLWAVVMELVRVSQAGVSVLAGNDARKYLSEAGDDARGYLSREDGGC